MEKLRIFLYQSLMSFSVFSFFSLVLLGSNQVQGAEPIQFVYAAENKEVFPYFIGNGHEIPKNKPGTRIEAIQLLDEKVDQIKITYERLPWKRCLLELESGRVDGLIASFKVERLKYGEYPTKNRKLDESKYSHSLSYCAYSQSNAQYSWNGEKFSNAKGMVFAVPRGYSIIEALKKEGIQVNEVDGIDQAVSMFRLYRVDGIAAPCLTADAEFERQKVDKEQFVKLSPPLVTKNYYLMLSKQFVTKHPKLSTKIWRISNKVAINNYPSIVKKYITVQHN